MGGDRDRVGAAAFVGTGVFAGGNAVAIRFSNRELEPLWGAAIRFALAAALLLGAMAVMRLERPRGREMTGALLFGLFNVAGAFGLFYVALVELHAGFGQILLALVPLATLLVAVLERQERFQAAALVGALVALAGIAVMSRTPAEAVPLLPVLAAIGSALCFAQSAVVVRHFPAIHPVATNAVGMTAGAVLLAIAAAVGGEQIQLPHRTATWVALAYVVGPGSLAVFLLYVVVLQRWAASRAAYVFVLIPCVTVALSAWLDDEAVGVGLLLGGLLVVAGVYVGVLRSPQVASRR